MKLVPYFPIFAFLGPTRTLRQRRAACPDILHTSTCLSGYLTMRWALQLANQTHSQLDMATLISLSAYICGVGTLSISFRNLKRIMEIRSDTYQNVLIDSK